ncbi:class I SAM-dependent methyltransferase [Sneathiella limimaris]|uniref:class I SAM-dependent methyltransferase n=1 Tax=Sneathiella limimaris TaxID=1964213 RepID=UPI00146A883F|nr:SAM-dependent methyltransferase [Sneathiella limimaris]
MTTPLDQIIWAQIQEKGPMPLDEFMNLALMHPEHGYYQRANPLGAKGDFITAPDISQMFGELIGLWCVDCWVKLGAPNKFILAEVGPGQGTLMQDALRSASLVPEFLEAADIHLVEGSRKLQTVQQATLRDYTVTWHQSIQDLPSDLPLILIGNEFLDALPIRQFEATEDCWLERKVALLDTALTLVTEPVADVRTNTELPSISGIEKGVIFELPAAAMDVVKDLALRLSNQNGVALFIDYGPMESGFGDSFQAVKNHKFVDPLANPGSHDLTAHVDFAKLASVAKKQGCSPTPIATQGRFLERLGIEARALSLSRNADEATKKRITEDLKRLVSNSGMGTLFKAFSFHHGMNEGPAGFS